MKSEIYKLRIILKLVMVIALCFVVLGICCAILYLTIIGFRAFPILGRILVFLATVTVGFLTIRYIVIRSKFLSLWYSLMDMKYSRKNTYESQLQQKYVFLKECYPLSIANFEEKCWRKTPKPSNYEIMENAVSISEDTWKESEKQAWIDIQNV